MKQLFIILLSISSILCTAHAQLLWGTTAGGGQHGIGTISSYNMQSKGISVAMNFESAMSNPVGKLALANNGIYYGVTTYGGDYGYGAIFSYNVATNKVVNVAGFNNTDGSYPTQGLVLAPDGKLYGTTQYGGTDLLGTIYSYDPAMNVITKLFDFKSTTASTPVSGNLLMGNNGKLYGTGEYGGANGYGALYSFDIATNTYATLFDFDWSSGYNMWGSLTGAIDGKLYGTTAAGGNGYGVIYSFDTTTNTFTDVYNFDTNNGWNPLVGLTQAADGNLYGTTIYGGAHNNGVLYCLHPGDNTYTRLHDFNYADGGYPTPNGEMLQASDGKLYGTTGGGIFSYSITDSSYTGVFNFNDTTGSGSQTSFVEGANGNLYDFTQDYGDRVDGSLFSFNINSNHYTTINVFGNQPSNPQGGLCIASDGKMYGMTASGGKYGDGVLYSINPSNSNYTKLIDFNGSNGASPFGNLMQATDGKLYGMTSAGGNNNAGVLFSYDPSTNTYTKLFDFVGVYGVAPKGSLLQASDGELYGMTTYGGTNNEGVIFSYDIPTHGFIQLHNFNHSVDGANPYGDLLEAADGKLYGLTTIGSIFSFNPSTATVTQLYYLPDSKFYGNLIQASDSKFYGLAYTGGAYGAGTIFSYDPATALLTQLHDFNGSDGANPFGSLLQASDGKLYGVTERGGVNDTGVVFSYDITSNSYQLLQSYTGDNGAHPAHFAFVETSVSKPTIKIRNASVTEGNSGSVIMSFVVTLSRKSADTVTVRCMTADNTAIAPSDYAPRATTIKFYPGIKRRIVKVKIKGDLLNEGDETFKVILSNPVHATIATGTAAGTILNDDGNTAASTKQETAKAGKQQQPAANSRTLVVTPNPATSVATVRLSGYSTNTTIRVNSLEGKLLKTIKTQGTSIRQISVADLANGTYLLTAVDEQGGKQTVKLIVIH